MGQNLSSKIVVNTTQDVISPKDAFNTRQTMLIWVATFYAIAMIWSTVALVDRWRGSQEARGVGLASVLTAIVISTAWPVVLGYVMALRWTEDSGWSRGHF